MAIQTDGEVLEVKKRDLYGPLAMNILADQIFYTVRTGKRHIKLARRGDVAPGRLIFKSTVRLREKHGVQIANRVVVAVSIYRGRLLLRV